MDSTEDSRAHLAASGVGRRALTYFLPWALMVVALAGYFFHLETRREIDRIKGFDVASTRLGVETLNASLRQVSSDLVLLTGYANLEQALESGSANAVARLNREFVNFARAHRKYDQIRWIDETGLERVRINAGPRGAAAVAAERLQNKRDRYYFTGAMMLQAGEFYVSKLDLNVEQGVVEIPYKPTLRVATPLFDAQGTRRGILVLNYLAEDMLERFRLVSERSEGRSVLLSGEGEWLASDHREDEWGFMFGRQNSFARRHPEAWPAMRAAASGQFEDAAGIWTFATVYPVLESGKSRGPIRAGYVPTRKLEDEQDYQWKVVTLLPAAERTAIYRRALPQTLSVTLAALLIMLVGSWRLALVRSRQAVAEEALRRSHAQLGETVEARTKQLRAEVLERESAERRYRESSEKYQLILATMRDAYLLHDAKGRILDGNPAACGLLGRTHGQLLDLAVDDIVAPGARAAVAGNLERARECGSARFEATLIDIWGGSVEVEFSVAYIAEHRHYVTLGRDISERRKIDSERRLASMVLANTDEGVIVCDADRHVINVNPAFSRITGYAPEEVIGRSPARLIVPRVDAALEVSVADLVRRLERDGSWHGEVSSRRKTGELYPVWLNISAVRQGDGSPEFYVAVFSDITPIKESQQRVAFLAHHDALTGLPNRLLFQARLDHSLERARRDGHGVAVLFVDLDRFKSVNDTLGHAAGDRLLRDVAVSISACLRGEDTIARLGGDEFVVLLEDLADRAAIDPVIHKIEALFPWRAGSGEAQIEVTASIGIACFPRHATDAETLLARADRAMYEAKSDGRGHHRYADAPAQESAKAPWATTK